MYSTIAPTKTGSIPNLDFLRACAVLFVLVDHTLNALGAGHGESAALNWLGRLGVLFFFVHTCCVLMMSLERHKGGGFFSNFYLRRALRIYPLSIVAVLVAMALPEAPKLSRVEWLANLALVQNLTFSGNAFGSIWTLPLEVQMYCFLPFIFLLTRWRRPLWAVMALLALSIPIAMWQPHVVARASVLAFFPAFLPGVLAYLLFRRRSFLPSWGLPLALAAITAGFLQRPNFMGSAWVACLLLGLLVPLFDQIGSAWVNRAAFEIAKYSYGIYLSHTALLLWARPSWRTVPLYLLAVGAASVASYHLIEHPMIAFGQRWIRHREMAAGASAVPETGIEATG